MASVKDFLLNIVYYLIGYTSLILYILGVLGVCLCIYLLATKFNKKNKLASLFTLFIICLSIIILAGGTILSLKEKKTDAKKNKTSSVQVNSDTTNTLNSENKTDKTKVNTVSNINSNTTTNNNSNTTSQKSQLTLEYSSNDLKCPISLVNNTAQIFNGTVTMNLLDSSKSSISKLTIPLSNFIQTTNTNNLQVTTVTSDLSCNYNGQFSNTVNSSIGYSITSLSLGSGYFSFDVTTNDVSLESLKHICETFKNTYNNSICKGFTIYFVSKQADNTNSIYAEYFCNNVTSGSSNLLIYADNSLHTI